MRMSENFAQHHTAPAAGNFGAAWSRRDAGGRGANLQRGCHHHREAAAEPFRWRKRRRIAHN